MRICYIIESLFNSGGMERVLTVCVNSLCKEFDISVLTLYQCNNDYYYKLSELIKKYDLNFKNIRKKRLLKKKLNQFFIEHKFDIIVSLGGIDMYYLHSIKDGSKKIVWFHFALDIAKKSWIGPKPTLLRKCKAQLQTWKRIFHAKKYNKIVIISRADLEEWKRYTEKTLLIYNPVTIIQKRVSDRKSKSVISVGRLDFQKGYDYLIDSWVLVSKKHPDWFLDIYGEGEMKTTLQKQINNLQLDNTVRLCGRTSNIEEKYPLYSIFVMSSRAEGFPLVLLEAASCGLPLISYDCNFGPREIIADGNNGFLVRNVGDIEELSHAINNLIENESLRNIMGDNAIRMVNRFSLPRITKEWHELFNETVANN